MRACHWSQCQNTPRIAHVCVASVRSLCTRPASQTFQTHGHAHMTRSHDHEPRMSGMRGVFSENGPRPDRGELCGACSGIDSNDTLAWSGYLLADLFWRLWKPMFLPFGNWQTANTKVAWCYMTMLHFTQGYLPAESFRSTSLGPLGAKWVSKEAGNIRELEFFFVWCAVLQ